MNTETEQVSFLLTHMLYILLEVFYLFTIAVLHHLFGKYMARLPNSVTNWFIMLFADLLLLSNLALVLPLIVGNLYVAFKHVGDLFT